MGIKKRFYEILEVAAPDDRASRYFDIFILSLITLNVAALVLETVEPVYRLAPSFFHWFEVVSVLVFTVEYVFRIWSCTSNQAYRSTLGSRATFALTPLAVIDLLAILPFYLPFLGLDLRSVRAIRLFRLFRLAKLSRYSTTLQLFGRVFRARKEALVTSLFFLALLLLVSSSLLYFIENESQPEVFSSIPAAMWWGVATLTTVGYGDVYPVTLVGKLIGSLIAILGIGVFALPTGILGAAFVEELQSSTKSPVVCPHCGRGVDLQQAASL